MDNCSRLINRTLLELGFDTGGRDWRHGELREVKDDGSGAGVMVFTLIEDESIPGIHSDEQLSIRIREAVETAEAQAVFFFVHPAFGYDRLETISEYDFGAPSEFYTVYEADEPAPVAHSSTSAQTGQATHEEPAASRAAPPDAKLDDLTGKTSFEIIELLRKHLIDQTRRNGLLNFTTSKDSIRVIRETPNDLFKILVQNTEPMTLVPLWPEVDAKGNPVAVVVVSDDVDHDLPGSKSEALPEYKDLLIQTAHSPKLLGDIASRAHENARRIMRQTGVNQLYLGLGFLEWYDNPESDIVSKAPLVLIPLEIKREKKKVEEPILPTDPDYKDGAQSSRTRKVLRYVYTVSYTEDEMRENAALALRMEDFDLPLPEFGDRLTTGDIEDYLQEVESWAAGYPRDTRWKVENHGIIGFFDFAQVWMYDDLGDLEWQMAGCKGVEELFGGGSPEPLRVISDEALEQSECGSDVPLVCPADTSQYEVIVQSLGKRSLVVEGPPGTGKSQTISNIIAACLKNGESILFLAAKETALSVVAKRLENCGLGHFLLSMHADGKRTGTSASDLFQQLNQRIRHTHRGSRAREQQEAQTRGLANRRRKQLNEVVAKLAIVEPGTEMLLSELAGEANLLWENYLAAADSHGLEPVELKLQPVLELFGRDQCEDVCGDFLDQLRDWSDTGELNTDSPWRGLNLGNVDDETAHRLARGATDLMQAWQQFVGHEPPPGLFHSEVSSTQEMLNVLSALRLHPIPAWNFDELGCEAEIVNRPLESAQVLRGFSKDLEAFHAFAKELSLPVADFPALEVVRGIVKTRSNLSQSCAVWHTTGDQYELKKLLGELKEIHDALGRIREEGNPNVDFVRDWLEVVKGVTAPDGVRWDQLKPEMATPEAEKLLSELEGQAAKLDREESELGLSLDFKCLPNESERRSLREDLRQDGLFSRLFGAHKKAKSKTKGFLRKPGLSGAETLRLLEEYESFCDRQGKFNKHSEGPRYFGSLCQGRGTSWNSIELAIELTGRIARISGLANLGSVLSGPGPVAEYLVIEAGLAQLERLGNLIDSTSELNRYQLDRLSAMRWEEMVDRLQAAISDLEQIVDWYDTVPVPRWRKFKFGETSDALRDSLAFLEMQESLDRHNAQKILGARFVGSRTGREVAENAAAAIGFIADLFQAAPDPGKVAGFFRECPWSRAFSKLDAWCEAVSPDAARLLELEAGLLESGAVDPGDVYRVSMSHVPASEWEAELSARCDAIDRFDAWRELSRKIEKGRALGLATLLDAFISGRCDTDYMRLAFKASLLRTRLRQLAESNNIGFDSVVGSTVRNARAEFQAADRKLIDFAPDSVAKACVERKPPESEQQSGARVRDKFGMALIKHGAGKRTMVSTRDLMERSMGTMQTLKPCWLMSPGSVSQYLPRKAELFDVLIVDEASQLRTAEVAPAALRCKRTLIFGDTKQMPPSDIMKRTLADNHEDYEVGESVLDRAAKAIPSVRLKWHYRSCHEDLIRYSNYHFYDNDLVIFPACIRDDPDLGVVYEHVGGINIGRKNMIEAQSVVEIAIAYILREHRKKGEAAFTLGIVAMNADQRELIFGLMEKARLENVELNLALNDSESGKEPWFVTNLESVQGDERDHIIISCTFGPEGEGLRPRNNFGPITNPGGERRLNVLFTRSRRKMTVLTSIHPHEITAQSAGARHFRGFLEFARDKELPDQGEATGNDPESLFEEAVGAFLSNAGHQFDYQVGVNGYRIDLAIKDPSDLARYILAIECDGATFHSSRTARERDRLRQEILESKGWKFHRIWSTDWFHERENAQSRLLHAIDTRIDEVRQGEMKMANEASTVDMPKCEQAALEESDDSAAIEAEELDEISSPEPEPESGAEGETDLREDGSNNSRDPEGINSAEIIQAILSSLECRRNLRRAAMLKDVCKSLSLSIRGGRREEFGKRIWRMVRRLKNQGVLQIGGQNADSVSLNKRG